MKVLVTGGSGYLGTHVRKFFDADDFSRRSNLDLLNLQDVHKAEEYDLVIHLAAHLDKSPDAAEEVFLTNVEGTLNLLRVISENTVFIFASTKDVYGRFADNYDEVPESCPTLYTGQSVLEWSKLIAEKYVDFYARKNNFRSCIFRLSTVYAPESAGNTPGFVSHYANSVLKEERLRLPADGRPVRDILHVDDFSRACRAFYDSVIRYGIYNLGGGRKNSLSLKELVEKLGELSSTEVNIDTENPLSAPAPMNYISDISLVTTELDWTPEVGIDKGLKTLLD
ncbi:MAG: NAD-dependent epimerase/dehydratase family protein [Pyrinomonadaceae bacterium]